MRKTANFKGFLEWLASNCKDGRKTVCLGWNREFKATIVNNGLRLDYGGKRSSGYLTEKHLELVWNRFWKLRTGWAVSKHYQNPNWQIKDVNLALPPYVPALIRDYLSS